MKITILGTESLGVRGLSCIVETENRYIFIDPGVALGYLRSGLLPHPSQVAVGARIREHILESLGRATDVIISHYHGNHIPLSDPTPYQISLSSFPTLPRARLWCKGPEHISALSTRRRDELLAHLGVSPVDSEGSGDDTIRCSHGALHGSVRSRRGTVMMTRIQEGNDVFVHASDIQLLDADAIAVIYGWQPKTVLVSGPPIYLPGLPHEERVIAAANARFLAESVDTLILDHHLLRSLEGLEWIERLQDRCGAHVCCAATYMGAEPLLLEARRKELYREMPVPEGWHDAYAKGETDTTGYEVFIP
jgi:predicted metallo-beta-lactamase superfamily hydrolase